MHLKTRRLAGWIGAALVALGLGLPGFGHAAGAPHLDRTALSEAFFGTVFGLEYAAGHPDADKVKRYAGEVRFFVADHSSAGRTGAAHRFLAALPRHIDNLRSSLTRRPHLANFKVILVDRADYAAVVAQELKADALAMGAHCIVGVTSVNGRIVRSTAVVVADDETLFARCLVEEVLQGLGPMNDDTSLIHSVFNDTSTHTSFTAFDRALMNVIYHPLIEPGMSRAEAAAVLPTVLSQLGYRQ